MTSRSTSRLLEAKLSSEYFDVLSASNGRAALRIADAELPDIILLDVMMPRMDGFEVCRRLKANPRTADIPVVMVTALSDTANRLRGLAAGADEFLTKPVNDLALFARVRSLVRLKRMMDEWRLREEICGRFGGRPVADDPTPARILIVEEDACAAAANGRGADADSACGDPRRDLRRGAGAARQRHRAGHRQPVGAGRRSAAARLALPRDRGAPPAADPADRRRRRSAAACQRARPRRQRLSRPSDRPQRAAGARRAPRSGANGCKTV